MYKRTLGQYTHRVLLPFLIILCAAIPIHGQQATIDLNDYYRFPLSLSVEYQSLTPLVAYPSGAPYTVMDIGASIRWPLPFMPVLQPTLRAGWTKFDSQSQIDPLKWDHDDIYGLLGLEYAHRFAKNFEIGANLLGGVSESLYTNLVLGSTTLLGNLNLVAEAGARLSLDPSYNFTIEVHPNLRYLMSLGELPDFDGLVFGIGFTASFRFGQDPDAPQAAVRAIRFEKPSIPNAFAALQSWYIKNRIGTVTLVNTEKATLTDVEVSYYQPSYMDSPTPGSKIPEINAGQSVEADLFALFNDKVFEVEGVTPLNGEVIVSYKMQGRSAEQRQSVSFDLYDKRAMVWNDDRKVSALITPDDSALKNYGGYIRQTCKGETTAGFSDALQLSMQVFDALGELGCLYQANTLLPFTKVQGNPSVVDTVHLARETLKSGLGDCSDLTVAFDSILESLAVDTGFITVPGHIYAAINTKVPTKDYKKIHPDRSMTLDVNGELWVPVEITLIGKAGFMEAWRKGVEEWTTLESSPQSRAFFVTKQARELYRPVGLKELDLGLQYGSKEALVASFQKDRDKLMDLIAADQIATAKTSGKKADWNKAGILYAQFVQYEKARQAFLSALAIDPAYVSASINLGNLLFLQKRYDEALTAYQNARKGLEGKALQLVLINISRAYYQKENYAQAKEIYGQAVLLDADAAKEFAYLAETGVAGTRAAEQSAPGSQILFSEE
jgi:tetratricopeptide (TPR) repeat protein